MHLQSIQTICTHSTWQWKRPTDQLYSSLYTNHFSGKWYHEIFFFLPCCHRYYGTNVGWLFLCARMHVMNLISCRFFFLALSPSLLLKAILFSLYAKTFSFHLYRVMIYSVEKPCRFTLSFNVKYIYCIYSSKGNGGGGGGSNNYLHTVQNFHTHVSTHCMSTNLFQNIFYFCCVSTLYLHGWAVLWVWKVAKTMGIVKEGRQGVAIETSFMLLLWLCHRFILSLRPGFLMRCGIWVEVNITGVVSEVRYFSTDHVTFSMLKPIQTVDITIS